MNEPGESARKRRWRWSVGGAMILIAALALVLGALRMVVDHRRALAERQRMQWQRDVRIAVLQAQVRAAEAREKVVRDAASEQLERLRTKNQELRREVERLRSGQQDETENTDD